MTELRLQGSVILIVEDEPLIAMDIADAFQQEGATVEIATKLNQALALAESEKLTAAIIDHALGNDDSTVLCERLTERGIPFTIYSGYANLDGACGNAPLVKKPASVEELIDTVLGLLQSKRGLQPG